MNRPHVLDCKPGDRLLCVDDRVSVPKFMQRGGIYTVNYISADRVHVVEDQQNHYAFYAWRFEVLEDWDE